MAIVKRKVGSKEIDWDDVIGGPVIEVAIAPPEPTAEPAPKKKHKPAAVEPAPDTVDDIELTSGALSE